MRCPACKGHFVVDTAPLRRIPDPAPAPKPVSPELSKGRVSEEERVASSAPAQNEEPDKEPLPRKRPNLSALWLLLPAFCLLLALIGILGPVLWKTPKAVVKQAAEGAPTLIREPPQPPAPSSEPTGDPTTETDPRPQTKGPFSYTSMWPFSPVEKTETCAFLARLQHEGNPNRAADRCGFYGPWIAYLSLEASSEPACRLETVFRMATDGITRGDLCGRGFAFLAAYYSSKRVLDRSRSFLAEALQLSPKDPWVTLVEGMVYERDFRDRERAIRSLSDLIGKEPSFSLAQYQLARIYIDEEEYGKARGLFLRLQSAFPRQHAFKSIEQSLASIEYARPYSTERARGLLKASRALCDLMDYPLAGRLGRKVLDEMPGALPETDRKSAFYDLGRIAEITGDRKTAFHYYQSALRIDPNYRDARERMAGLLKKRANAS